MKSGAVAAMLELLHDERALRQHVTDAAIAQQLPPPTDAQWLAKCRKVEIAKDKLRGTLTEQ